MAIEQLAFDISQNPSYAWENYFVTDANGQAVSWIKKWPQWNNRCLILQGPKACGKTHLAHLWQREAEAVFLTPQQITKGSLVEIISENPHVIIEDLDILDLGEHYFHLFNLVHEHQGFMLMTSSSQVALLEITLKDLDSRLKATPSVAIHPPDDYLMQALLIKGFADRQLRVNQDIITYILRRIKRSYVALRATLERLDEASLTQGRNLTLPLVRQVIDSTQNISSPCSY